MKNQYTKTPFFGGVEAMETRIRLLRAFNVSKKQPANRIRVKHVGPEHYEFKMASSVYRAERVSFEAKIGTTDSLEETDPVVEAQPVAVQAEVSADA